MKALARELHRSLVLLRVHWHWNRVERAMNTALAYQRVAQGHKERAKAIYRTLPPSLVYGSRK